MNKELVIYAGIGALSVGAGFGGGYLIAKKRHEKIANAEIASVRHAYSQALQEKPDLEQLAERYEEDVADAVEVQQKVNDLEGRVAYSKLSTAPIRNEFADEEAEKVQQEFETKVVEEVNTFDRNADEVVNKVDPTTPYVISIEDWSDGAWDSHDKTTLTYYAEDEILADDADQIYESIEQLVGTTNLTRFGYLSEDPDIVYVRNERIAVDFEITRNDGSYSDMVQGPPEE